MTSPGRGSPTSPHGLECPWAVIPLDWPARGPDGQEECTDDPEAARHLRPRARRGGWRCRLHVGAEPGSLDRSDSLRCLLQRLRPELPCELRAAGPGARADQDPPGAWQPAARPHGLVERDPRQLPARPDREARPLPGADRQGDRHPHLQHRLGGLPAALRGRRAPGSGGPQGEPLAGEVARAQCRDPRQAQPRAALPDPEGSGPAAGRLGGAARGQRAGGGPRGQARPRQRDSSRSACSSTT